MGSIEGRYFVAGSSASQDARFELVDGLAMIRLADGSQTYSGEVALVSDRLGNVVRKITLKDGSLFETPDNSGVDELFDAHKSFFNRLTHIESSVKLVAILAVVTMLVLFGAYRYGLPILARVAANVTPTSVLSLMDAGARETVDRVIFSKTKLDDKKRAVISVLFEDLKKQSGQIDPPLRLLFRDGGILGANAIALPGGTVIITDQLVGKAKSDDEIAGVLGHEIGHVELRHSLRQIYRVLGISFMITIIGGDSSQLVEDVIAQASALENLSYSRKFETESDYRSAELMVGLGRDPYAFVELLKRITLDKGEKSDTGWLATHPGTFDRMATVKKYVNSLEP